MMKLTIKPIIVCLCGSTRFYNEFQAANFRETMDGKIVFSVGFYPHSSIQAHGQAIGITVGQKAMLDQLHKCKIDLADEILVLDVGGYVGESTLSEIDYARETGTRVRYLSQETDNDDEHTMRCNNCGKSFDMRDLDAVLQHEICGDEFTYVTDARDCGDK